MSSSEFSEVVWAQLSAAEQVTLLLVPATTGSGASKIFESLPTGPAFTAIGLIWALLFGLTVTLLNRKAGNTDETLSLFSTIPVLTEGGNEILR